MVVVVVAVVQVVGGSTSSCSQDATHVLLLPHHDRYQHGSCDQ